MTIQSNAKTRVFQNYGKAALCAYCGILMPKRMHRPRRDH